MGGRIKPQMSNFMNVFFILTIYIVSSHVVSLNIITSIIFLNIHCFLEPCSEKRSCSVLSTETLGFTTSFCIAGSMVEIKLRDVLLYQKTITVKINKWIVIRYKIIILFPLHFSIVTSFPWLKKMEYLRPLQNYLSLVEEPFELVQSRDGIMVHLHDVAGSS